MNLAGLIREYRRDADDNAQPPFVADEDLADFANEAEDEACRRAELLVDSASSLATLKIKAGEALVRLDPRIIDVRRAKLASQPAPLGAATADEMDARCPQWEAETGAPRAAVTDYQTQALRLWPTPGADDTLRLTLVRLPLRPMANGDDAPEIPSAYHRGLAQWMLYRVYSMQDGELFNPQKAAAALANFEREFGRRQSARNEQWRRQRAATAANPIA